MQRYLAHAAIAAILSLPVCALAADAESIMQTMAEKHDERMAAVQNYTVDQSMAGTRALLYFERFVISPAGPALFRMVPLQEIQRRNAEKQGITPMTPDAIKLYANGIEGLGKMMAQEIGSGGEGLIAGEVSDLTGVMAGYLREGADAETESIARGSGAQDALDSARGMADFARMAHLVGTETVNGRDAFLLRADDVNDIQRDGDQEFTINTASFWIDTADYVVLKMKIDGIAESDGQSRAMTIEKIDSDFRTVAGSRMYQPFMQKFRIAGIMTPEEQADMKEAAKQLKDFKAQLRGMPTSQQAMIKKMMGAQMETLESIVKGDGIVATVEVHAIRVNLDGPPSGVEMGKVMFSVPQ